MPDRGVGVYACRQRDCKIIRIIGVTRSVGR